MNVRKIIHRLVFVILALLITCSNSGAGSGGKTQVLPADGGELGKAFVELKTALKTADKAVAAKLLDPNAWHLDNKEPDWFESISERLSQYRAVGGKRQGARATLFVMNDNPYYAMMNAAYVAGKWRFDSPLPMGSSFSNPARDCKALPTRFPCSAQIAPEARVSGTVQPHGADPLTKAPFRQEALIDGLAVRMLDAEANSLKSIWIVLSGTGINPQMVALSSDPDHVRLWLNYPALTLEVAPDGKSAKATYYDGYSPKDFAVSGGLTVDMKTQNRIRGSLKTDIKDAAKFDITFDLGTDSDCLSGKYNCTE